MNKLLEFSFKRNQIDRRERRVIAGVLKRLQLRNRRSDFITGIALREDHLALAQIQQSRSGPKLVTALAEPSTQTTLAKQLHELMVQHKPERGRLVSVLNHEQFTLYNTEPPAVGAEEMRDAIRWRLKEMINFDIEQAAFDIFEVPGQDERGRQKVLYAAVSRDQTIRDHIKLFQQLGLQLDAIDIPELAYRNIAMLLPEDDKQGLLMLRMQPHAGLITITHDQNMFLSRRTSIGLDQIVSAAEKAADDELTLHDEHGLALDRQPYVDKITLEIQRTLDYYTRNFAMPPITKMVIAPLEQPIEGLRSYLQESLGLETGEIDFNQLLQPDIDISQELQSHTFAAIGAALRQFGTK
ncbi:hypothetical protein D5085_02640 [Ectothiorhodospiraceae bacterium BW-2]|nr:hypothetical protein D5085_02640 [Ectothiorhodospiraceae bacterium BW-2]